MCGWRLKGLGKQIEARHTLLFFQDGVHPGREAAQEDHRNWSWWAEELLAVNQNITAGDHGHFNMHAHEAKANPRIFGTMTEYGWKWEGGHQLCTTDDEHSRVNIGINAMTKAVSVVYQIHCAWDIIDRPQRPQKLTQKHARSQGQLQPPQDPGNDRFTMES